MRMYKIQRTTKSNTAHRYRTNFGRFLKEFEISKHGEKVRLYEKKPASFINKQLRQIDRKHNYKMVPADNI